MYYLLSVAVSLRKYHIVLHYTVSLYFLKNYWKIPDTAYQQIQSHQYSINDRERGYVKVFEHSFK